MLEVEDADLVGLPPRDRVFELMMARLEALVPFRPGLARLARSARGDPASCWRPPCASALAGLAAGRGRPAPSGLRASLARRALGAAYLQALRVWLEDEAADLGRTMAELDKQLRRVQAFAGLRAARRPDRAGETPGADINEGEAPLPA